MGRPHVDNMSECISAVEFALFETKDMHREAFRIAFGFNNKGKFSISINQIRYFISRIVNVLSASKIEKYILIFEIPREIDDETYRKQLIQSYDKKYIVSF